MLAELKQGPGLIKIVLQAIRLKQPLPKAATNPPWLFPWLHVFYNAFIDLLGDRNWERGPIMWTAREQWARVHGLDALATRLLHTHVKALDLAFLQWKRDNQPKGGSGDGHGKSRGFPIENQ